MKGFFRFLFYSSALLILAGFASLYFGWIRFDYPNTYRGVVHFKSSGYEKTLLTPQTWTWNWQNIIPGNTTIYAVNLSPQTGNLKISGNLPSAEALSELVDGKESFSYDVSLNYSYRLKEDALVSLYSSGLLTESNNQSSLKTLLEKPLKDGLDMTLSELFKGNENPDIEDILKNQLQTELTDAIKSQFPSLEDFEIDIQIIRFPNLLLYQTANRILLDILNQKEQEKRAEEIRQARGASEEENRLLWLERYGKLLKDYPDLKELLTSENLKLFSFFRNEA